MVIVKIVENRGKAVLFKFPVLNYIYSHKSCNVSQTFVCQIISTLEGDFGSDLDDCAQRRNMVDFPTLRELEPSHLDDDINYNLASFKSK